MGTSEGLLHPGRARPHRGPPPTAAPARSAVGMHQMAIYCGVIAGGFSGYVADGPGWRWPSSPAASPAWLRPPLTLRCASAGRAAVSLWTTLRAGATRSPRTARRPLVPHFTLLPWRDGGARLERPSSAGVRHQPGPAGVVATLYWQVAAIRGSARRRVLADAGPCGTRAAASPRAAIGMASSSRESAGVATRGRWPSRGVPRPLRPRLGFLDGQQHAILWQVVRPGLRATGYGLMNLVSISCGGSPTGLRRAPGRPGARSAPVRPLRLAAPSRPSSSS